MIYSIKRHELLMDFSNIEVPYGQPSDIDMFYVGNTYVMFGEIKNEQGTFTNEQKGLYEMLARKMVFDDVLIMYITHDKRVEDGDERVDISNCNVCEWWYKPSWKKEKLKQEKPTWRQFSKPITVKQLFRYYISKREEKPIKEWGKKNGK